MFLRLLRPTSSFSSFTILAVLFLFTFFLDCSILSFGVCDNLKLITGSIYYPNFQIYRFFTFFLVNTNFLLFVFDVCGYVAFELTLQKRWNIAERTKFLVITTWLPGLFCLIYYYIKFANTKTEADLYHTGVCGSSAFVAAVTVVIKQLTNETSNQKSQIFRRYGPLMYLSTIACLQLVGAIPSITFAYTFLGLFSGWTYLRFVQKHTDGKYGDFRSCFSFAR